MNDLSSIGDNEFVSFLQALGVETYKKSFEWILNSPNICDVLKWMYLNLDHNNALTVREECRYAELDKHKCLLTPEQLETNITVIKNQFDGLCLPGDDESIEDLKISIKMLKDKLVMLENHEVITNNMIKQNKFIKEEVDIELRKLSGIIQEYAKEEEALGEQCLVLAEQVENIVDNVVDVLGDALNMCGNVQVNKQKFFTYGPYDSYRQSQAIFTSHFELYLSKYFSKKKNYVITDEELKSAQIEAKNLEERLSDAISTYIENEAELRGEQAKLTVVTNYDSIHPSQLSACAMEAQSSVEFLKQEECILEQELQNAVIQFVDYRTGLAVETAARAALAVRKQIQNNLITLINTTHQALALDKFLYFALRSELQFLEELVYFAVHFKEFVVSEEEATCTRIKLMNEICAEQSSAEQKLQSTDILQNALFTILDGESCGDPVMLTKLYSKLQNNILELNKNVAEALKKRETMALVSYKDLMRPIQNYIWDGATKQPNCFNRSVAAMMYTLQGELNHINEKVLGASTMLASAKNGDKQSLRKIWQWFLTNQKKLLSAMQDKIFT